jgi:hypothetical protein
MAFHDEGRRLRALASDPDIQIFYSGHAELRMAEREISRFVVDRIIRAGSVIDVECPLGSDERWKAQGMDTNGRTIHVVLIPHEAEIEIDIITVIAP